MSARPAAPDPIDRGYVRAFFSGVVVLTGLALLFTLLIDPYGVSPIRLDMRGVNALKPKRFDIDRLIKPFEVWRYQPRTVFLGTSRISQSIDPAVLEGTRFAPAYNASIPSSSLALNIAHLRQYSSTNARLRTVVMELFLYNFIKELPESETQAGLIGSAVSLFMSRDALSASVSTLVHNVWDGRRTYEIKPGGYLDYPPGHDPRALFDDFAAWIWTYHDPDRMRLLPSAIDAVKSIVDLARERNLELIFLVTPYHVYFDYYFEAVGSWELLEEWLLELSGRATVYSFSQHNAWTNEAAAGRMTYWNDPLHFTLEMGRGMLARLASLDAAGIPDNFMERLTPERVASHIERRRQAVRRWAQDNPSFVMRLEEERRKRDRARDGGGARSR